MTQLRRILSLTTLVVLALSPCRVAAQTAGGEITSFGVANGGTGNAISVDSRYIHMVFYEAGNLSNGTPPTIKHTAIPHSVVAPPAVIDTVDTLATSTTLTSLSVASDSQGLAHIVYEDGQGDLKYATQIGGFWTPEFIATANSASYNSIVIDSHDIPHVVYFAGGHLFYATRTNGVWTSEGITFNGSITGVSIVVDSHGQPQVAWGQHVPTDSVVYAARGTGLWHQEIVSGVDALWVSLAIDATDTPSVSYWGWNGGVGSFTAEVDYATRVPGAFGAFWQIQAVDLFFNLPCCIANPFTDNMTSLALSPKGQPRISYGASAGVKFARRDPSGLWSTQVIDNQPADGITFTSLGVDATDNAYILYRSAATAPAECTNTPGQGSCLVYQKLETPNTPAGSNIIVSPQDSTTAASPATLTFGQVTQAGQTSLSTSSTGPALPAGFQLANPAVYYDLSTTAQFTGSILICITSPAVTSSSQLWHFGSAGTVNITSSVSPPTICGTSSSLSPFAILQPVVLSSSSTGLSVSPNPAAAGQLVTLSSGVSTGTGSGPAPTGSVTFLDGATPLGPGVNLPNSGPAMFTIRTLAAGTHAITAQYSGDTNFSSSTSPAVILTVNLNVASLGLAISPNPALAGQWVTLTSGVSGATTGSGIPAPTGSVTFLDGGAPITSPVNLPNSGPAMLTIGTLAAGMHTITAQYNGDMNYSSSTSIAVSLTVNKSASSIGLSASPNPSAAGQLVTFTSGVTGSAPTGTGAGAVPPPSGSLTFLDGGTPLGPAVPLPTNNSGPAMFTISTLAPGTHTITAQYSGDGNYFVSTSPAVIQTVNSFSTTITINAATVTYGSPPSVTVSVRSSGGTVGGNVSLSVDGSPASIMALTNGSIVFNLGVLNAGPHTLSANFATQGSFSASSAAATLTVAQAPLTGTPNPAPRFYGTNNPAAFPVSYVGFVNGDTSSVLIGLPICTTTAMPNSPVGTYPIMCSGVSSPNYAISFINGTLIVIPETTSLAVAFSPLSIMVGQTTTATITLTAPNMVIPIDPSVLANITLSSPSFPSDILSNNGVCTPVPSAAPGVASCTITVTSVEPNGRTLNASFPGSADLTVSSATADLMVTAALQSQPVCIASDFRNVAVTGGSYVWFNSIFKVRDVTKQLIHVSFFKSSVQFQYTDPAGNPVTVNQSLPDAKITIDPNATSASTSFDAINNVWITTIPWDLDDNTFLTGMPWLVPSAGLPADVEPVTVCGTFASDVANVDIGWRWAAAAYSSFSTDNTTLGVKPMDTDHDNQATNHDRAGTPENYHQFVIPGARGKGGKNCTGTYSRSALIE